MQILQMQDDFFALQDDFRRLKDFLGKRISDLEKQLEKQQARAEKAECQVIFLEDQVRFYEDQADMIAGHWKAVAGEKEASAKFLELRLVEISSDKKDKTPSQQEHICLQGRHQELAARFESLQTAKHSLDEKMEACTLENIDLKVRLERFEKTDQTSQPDDSAWVEQLERENAALRAQLQLLEQQQAALRKEEEAAPECVHKCIWKDQLEVRVGQLERLSSQLDQTYLAYHKGQDDLGFKAQESDVLRRQLIEYEWQLRDEQKRRRRIRNQLQQSDHVLAMLRQRREESRRASWRERIDEIRHETRAILDSLQNQNDDVPEPDDASLEPEEHQPGEPDVAKEPAVLQKRETDAGGPGAADGTTV